MSNIWHFFLFFGALLWPNGLIFWSFVNCSEEILSVRVWKYFCFGPGNFFGFLKKLCFCPKIKFFWQSLTLSCDQTVRAGLDWTFSKSWGLNSDDFPFFWNLSSPYGSRYRILKKGQYLLAARERQRFPKNLILGQKHKIFKNPKKFPGPKQKYF